MARHKRNPEESIEDQELMFLAALTRAKDLQDHLHASLPMCRVLPLPTFARQITVGQWKKFQRLVLMGVTPSVASQQSLFISPGEFRALLKKGAAAHPGSLTAEFYRAVSAVQATARGLAEARVYYEIPGEWLKGPGGRGEINEENWANQSTVRHTGADGESDPTVKVRLEFSVDGPKTIKETPPALKEVNE